jgi:hypothetical protein
MKTFALSQGAKNPPRAFVKIRQVLASHEEIRRKIEEHDKKISVLFDAVRQLMTPPLVPPKRKIGFHS